MADVKLGMNFQRQLGSFCFENTGARQIRDPCTWLHFYKVLPLAQRGPSSPVLSRATQ